ncbi:MAG: CrcB family protein [Candidatus Omnitrophica bacterium]|nr:CrcB family protein [Candidatus Omnitrophota bacterium]
MNKFILLAAGGVFGAVGRYVLSGVVYRLLGTGFAYGTLAVNTLGCFGVGFLASLAERKFLMTPEMRIFWMIGLFGAFTTFSTLIFESWKMIQQGQSLLAGGNLAVSLILGFAALWIGTVMASAV